MKLTVNIIGAGMVGKVLGRLLVNHDAAKILGICNRSLASGQQAGEFIGAGQAVATIAALPPADITFITTQDDQIQACSMLLCQSKNLKPDSVLIHCSGLLPASVMQCVKEKSCLTYSVHPMKSFSNLEKSLADYAGTRCTIEGDQGRMNVVFDLFEKIGSTCFNIDSQNKALYHVAGIFASNYLVTLYETAINCFESAGIDRQSAKLLITDLMSGTLENIKNAPSAEAALTGPIKRGDCDTIKQHLSALNEPQKQMLYKVLGLNTLPFSGASPEINDVLKTLFSA